LGINTHTNEQTAPACSSSSVQSNPQHERRSTVDYWLVFFFRTALLAKCNATLVEEGIRVKAPSSSENPLSRSAINVT
jgi:hypothetical protein